jgi:hypothetical protein
MSNLNLGKCNQVEGSKSLKNSFLIQEIPYLEELNRRSHWDIKENYNCYIIIDINYIVTCFFILKNVYHNIIYSYILGFWTVKGFSWSFKNIAKNNFPS